MAGIRTRLQQAWQLLRRLSGDDAYERYLRLYARHGHTAAPLSREAFFRAWQEEQWDGVKRCC
ncbi:YbdD/YjiX family protein [Methylobacillus gramineus]|uniref:CstA-like transporter-associated (seleno)protein n=1 Tax=Methylobacillus gramineus TaxID=755169 RepID=UPI001CFF6775|nr:YbdD/YjiX family protein [Methylobacillus gramineus]MCB5185362.1 YbdD/YjiX family protein [Methylobacillus gramineus]